jgi:hypothetical protein
VKAVAFCLAFALVCGTSAFSQAPAAAPASISQDGGAKAAPVAAAPSAPPPPNTLLDGTAVKLRLAESISSEKNKTGDQIPFEVVDEVVVDGVVVAPKGAQAIATVTNASPKKSMGRGGKLDVNVDSMRLVDGEKVQLRAVQENKGGGHVGAMTGAMVATSIVFFPAAPLFLFIHGKPVEIPKGTVVTAFVEGDMHLDMAKMAPPTTIAAPLGAPAAATATEASVAVDSTVAGADIEVDGNFVGSTPSTVSVAPGQHTFVVKKKGYADWSRSMMVSGNAAHLSAELEAKP